MFLSMALSFVSCNKVNVSEKKKNRIIANDSPWYDGELLDVDLAIDSNKSIEYLETSFVGADENYIVLFSDGSYKVNNWSSITKNSDYAIKTITVINRESKQIDKNIDLYDIVDGVDWPTRATYSHGQVIIRSECWDSKTESEYDADYYIDIDTENVKDKIKVEQVKDVYFSGRYSIGEYQIEVLCDQRSEFRTYLLEVKSTDGEIVKIDIEKKGKDLYGIPVILTLSDTSALIPVALEREYEFYKLNLIDKKLTKLNEKDYEWLNLNQLQHSYNGQDGNVYFTTPQGVSKIDIENKSVEQVLDYNNCDVNRQYLSHLDIAECSDGSFLLCGQYNSSNMFTSLFVNNFTVVEFTKAKKNPHTGKRIIELYTPEGIVDETLSDAIIKYNNNNNKYFIELSDRYNRLTYLDYSDVGSLDDYDLANYTANEKLSNDLAIDLMNGEGPDILLNTSDLGQLNNDNYLVDLSPYITALNTDRYFTNIIDGAKYDDKLYQLPVSFTINGIQTDPAYAGKTGIGFTTGEYRDFLYETLNGKDVIESGQSMYFVKLFNGMSDKFIEDGKADFTGLEFKDIAGYVKDNVQQDSITWNSITVENEEPVVFITNGNKTAYYCICPGISGYLVKRAQIKNGTAILGIPSSDGRGPMFGTDISVAISSHAVDIDACVEFMKILLSDEIQHELVMSDRFVLNRDEFKAGCNAAIEYFNTEEGSQNMFDYAAGTYVTSHMKFTSEDIDNLESIIMSCSKMNSADSAINAILIEEMPAYFLGQKDLDSVVVIIQDRAQKVLDERS
jgi:ABC-type glycerol-3-phosphate transport system substrate-binding protein